MIPGLHIGTSGFNMDGWDREFYPAGTKQRERLLYYSTHIPTVEITATKHVLPRRDVFEKWAGLTPSDFIFSFALLKGMHPNHVLSYGTDQMDLFYKRASLLGDKLGPLAITIPEGTPYVKGDANRYFSSLPAHRYAIDIQAIAWYNDECFKEMHQRDYTFVRDRMDDSDGIGSWDYYRAPIVASGDSTGVCACGCETSTSNFLRVAESNKRDTYFYAKQGKEGLTPNLILRLLKIFGPKNRINFIDLTDVKKKVLGPGDKETGGTPYYGSTKKYEDGSDKIDVMKADPYRDNGKQLLSPNYPDKEWDGLSEPYGDKVDKGY